MTGFFWRLILVVLLLWAGTSCAHQRHTASVSSKAPKDVASGTSRGTWSEREITFSAYAGYIESRIHYENGHKDKALAHLDLALAFDEESVFLHTSRINLLVELGRLEEALDAAEPLLEAHPRDPRVLLARARVAEMEKDWDKAVLLGQKAVELEPDNTEAHLLLSFFFMQRQEPEGARKALEAVLSQGEGDPQVFVALGNVCLELESLECARDAFEKLVKLHPREELGYLKLGGVLEVLGHFEASYGAFVACTEVDRFAADCWFERVRMRERLAAVHAPKEVRAHQRELLLDEVIVMADALSSVSDLASNAARRLLHLEDPALLEAFVARCAWRRDPQEELFFHLGILHERQDQFEAAVRSFSRVPPLSSFWLESRTRAAVLLSGMKRWNESIDMLDQVLEREPGEVPVVLLKGAVQERKGDIKGALRSYQDALTRASDESEEHRELLKRIKLLKQGKI